MYQLGKKLVIKTLTWEAKLILRRFKPKIIAITGNVGKTSAKDAIYAVLKDHAFVRKSEKSMNSELGVPLTIIGSKSAWGSASGWIRVLFEGLITLAGKKYPEWLALEVGADKPGDIENLARWLVPDIVVVTTIPDTPVHVEFFSSPEELAKEKGKLIDFLKPEGHLVLNGDDARVRSFREKRRDALLYGFGDKNVVRASYEEIEYADERPIGMRFRAEADGSSVPVRILGALGAPRMYAALAALTIAKVFGIDFVTAAQSLKEWTPPPGRTRILDGANGSVLLDDTYNSSPTAVLSALETLRIVKGFEKKIAILGDMLELGKFSATAHKEVGVAVAQSADMLVTVGLRARGIAEAAIAAGLNQEQVRMYEHGESERVCRELRKELRTGVVVLVKGSQSIRMEKTVKELMADASHAKDLLVRQEEEWLRK